MLISVIVGVPYIFACGSQQHAFHRKIPPLILSSSPDIPDYILCFFFLHGFSPPAVSSIMWMTLSITAVSGGYCVWFA